MRKYFALIAYRANGRRFFTDKLQRLPYPAEAVGIIQKVTGERPHRILIEERITVLDLEIAPETETEAQEKTEGVAK